MMLPNIFKTYNAAIMLTNGLLTKHPQNTLFTEILVKINIKSFFIQAKKNLHKSIVILLLNIIHSMSKQSKKTLYIQLIKESKGIPTLFSLFRNID